MHALGGHQGRGRECIRECIGGASCMHQAIMGVHHGVLEVFMVWHVTLTIMVESPA